MRVGARQKHQVFVSHASGDESFVEEELLPRFREQQLACWYSPRDLNTGDFSRRIVEALESCDAYLVVGSPNALQSDWVRSELEWIASHRWDADRVFLATTGSYDIARLHPRLLLLERADYSVDPQRARSRLDAWIGSLRQSTHEPLILTIIGAKGGVGKSTIACRMADIIAETGHNVLTIDLDTIASGMTHLQRGRGIVPSHSLSTYEIVAASSRGEEVPIDIPCTCDVTPPYLARQHDAGRVFLIPAVPTHHSGPPMFTYLTQMAQQGTRSPRDILDYMLDRAAGECDVPIHCVIIDCGAEGEEFNTLVTEAHARARLTYIVVQPNDVCRKSVDRIRHLAARGGAASASKLRLIVNQIHTTQHEPVARSLFSDFEVAGCILDDRRYFEDIQKGRIDPEGYDTISRGIRDALAFSRDIPPAMVPQESDIWLRKAVRLLMEDTRVDRLAAVYDRVAGPGRIGGLVVGILFALVGVLSGSLAIYRQLGHTVPLPGVGEWSATLHSVVAAGATALSATLLTFSWMCRQKRNTALAILYEVDRIKRSSSQPHTALLEYLRQQSSNSELGWLRAASQMPHAALPVVRRS